MNIRSASLQFVPGSIAGSRYLAAIVSAGRSTSVGEAAAPSDKASAACACCGCGNCQCDDCQCCACGDCRCAA